MKHICIEFKDRCSELYFGRGLLQQAGEIIAKHIKGRTAVVVGDSNTLPLYGDVIGKSLQKVGFKGGMVEIPAGETSKNIDILLDLYQQFYENDLTRDGVVIALGGGVVGDLAGYVAATFLRGVQVVQIPTSLLAQVDSSIGGKTAIDMPFGKNTVGAFHQPKVIITDPSVLKTLKPEFYSDGMAEVIKYGCISDKVILDTVAKDSFAMDDVIWRCIEIKANIVMEDEMDSGKRMLLNFGHTVGHAIEKCENFVGLSHGAAVGVGMLRAIELGDRLGVSPIAAYDEVKALLEKFDLPTTTKIDDSRLEEAISADKKRDSSGVNFVFITELGNAITKRIEIKEIFNG